MIRQEARQCSAQRTSAPLYSHVARHVLLVSIRNTKHVYSNIQLRSTSHPARLLQLSQPLDIMHNGTDVWHGPTAEPRDSVVSRKLCTDLC